jgi:hypothetical protein
VRAQSRELRRVELRTLWGGSGQLLARTPRRAKGLQHPPNDAACGELAREAL